MIIKLIFYCLILIQINSFSVFKTASLNIALVQNTSAQQVQSTPNTDDHQYDMYDDEFSLFLFALVVGAILIIAIGLVLTVLVLLIIFGLIGAGILSTSILVGLHKKSFSKGFKTFIVSGSAIAGLIAGLVVFWAIHEFSEYWSLTASLLSGGITGTLSGLLLGYFAFYVIQKLTAFLKTKLKALEKK